MKKKMFILGVFVITLLGTACTNENIDVQPTTEMTIEESNQVMEEILPTENIEVGSETIMETDINKIKESIMETASDYSISAEDYKDARDIESIMKKIIDKTN